MDFDIGTPQLPQKPGNLDEVLMWLTEKGATADIIEKINAIKVENDSDTATVSEDEPIDPWRQLQSSKDKLNNIEREIQALDVRLYEAQRIADDLQEQHDALQVRKKAETDMIDKMKVIALSGKESQPAPPDIMHKLNQYEDLIGQIQQMVATGLPTSEHAAERHELYNLIFFGQKERPSDQASSPQPSPDNKPPMGDPSIEVVDRSGFGFGPVKGARPEPTPYAAVGKGYASPAEPGGELSAPESSKA